MSNALGEAESGAAGGGDPGHFKGPAGLRGQESCHTLKSLLAVFTVNALLFSPLSDIVPWKSLLLHHVCRSQDALSTGEFE
jgi:hypothetical protein